MKSGTPLQRYRLLIAVVFIVVVLILTHIPQNYVTEKMALVNADKIVHTVAYGLMAVLLAGVFKMPVTLRKLFVLLVILCALGYVDEYTQQWIGRPFSIRDWLADIAGISLALAAYFVARRRTFGSVSTNRSLPYRSTQSVQSACWSASEIQGCQ